MCCHMHPDHEADSMAYFSEHKQKQKQKQEKPLLKFVTFNSSSAIIAITKQTFHEICV